MPSTLTMEPDQATAYCVNLCRARRQFAVEIDPAILKDVVVVHRDAVLQHKAGWSHQRRTTNNCDDACQYVVNLIGAAITFQVNPESLPGAREQWLFLIEVRESGRVEAY